jgi:hypothetical protein
MRDALICEPDSKPFPQRGTGEGACQNAHQGDADLDGREEAPGIFRQGKCGRCARLASFGHAAQARAAGGDHRKLGEGKDPVQHNENENDRKLYQESPQSRTKKVPVPRWP